MDNHHYSLGGLETSEYLIQDLYIELRKKINKWAELTKQTAQARMGYVGQHLVSVVTGCPGGKSGARGYDLILSDGEFAEIKTCYRVDQLGKCNSCGEVIASIEASCQNCGSNDVKRNEDSKWLIGIRHDNEFDSILDPKYYFLVLFDFVDLKNPNEIRASIWRVNSMAPGFAYCMIDYYLNIRAKSASKAPFNLWPYQLKFYLMKPVLIYQSIIKSDDTIQTIIFPKRDKEVSDYIKKLVDYSRSKNLTKDKIITLANILKIKIDSTKSNSVLLSNIDDQIIKRGIKEGVLEDIVANILYFPEIEAHFSKLPQKLRKKINIINNN